MTLMSIGKVFFSEIWLYYVEKGGVFTEKVKFSLS